MSALTLTQACFCTVLCFAGAAVLGLASGSGCHHQVGPQRSFSATTGPGKAADRPTKGGGRFVGREGFLEDLCRMGGVWLRRRVFLDAYRCSDHLTQDAKNAGTAACVVCLCGLRLPLLG